MKKVGLFFRFFLFFFLPPLCYFCMYIRNPSWIHKLPNWWQELLDNNREYFDDWDCNIFFCMNKVEILKKSCIFLHRPLLFYAPWIHVQSFKIIDLPESEKIVIEKKVKKEVKHGISYVTRKLNYIFHHSK